MTRRPLVLGLLTASFALGACTSGANSSTSPAADAPLLLNIAPANQTAGVSPVGVVTLAFNMAMMQGMEMLVVVHEGSVTGAQVAGSSAWSTDRRTMTFTPASALKARTTYVVHLSPSLQGTNGRMINTAGGMMTSGQSVSGSMMGSTGSMMNGQWGPGMVGAGWQAAGGTYGMMFTFTTA
jgi:hypothetical protein